MSIQQTHGDAEAVMLLKELNRCIFRHDPSSYLQNFRKTCELSL